MQMFCSEYLCCLLFIMHHQSAIYIYPYGSNILCNTFFAGDKYIDQVNQIRESLAIMGDNSTAFSLPQPHLHWMKLCELNNTDLDPGYVEKREKLKDLVGSFAHPKVLHGKAFNGRELFIILIRWALHICVLAATVGLYWLCVGKKYEPRWAMLSL